MRRARVLAKLALPAVLALGLPPANGMAHGKPGKRPQRCQTKSRSGSTGNPEGGWGATWGWGWQAGTFLHLAEDASVKRTSGHAGCKGTRQRKSTAKHGISTTTPTSSAPGSSGSTGTGSGTKGTSTPAEVPGSSSPAPVTGNETPESPTPPSIPHVQVTAVEYHFTLSRTSVPAGKVAFDFVNSGQDEHNLKLLSEEGSITGSFPDTVSKGVHDLTFEMRPGHYTLFCSLPEHEAKGMKATLTVE